MVPAALLRRLKQNQTKQNPQILHIRLTVVRKGGRGRCWQHRRHVGRVSVRCGGGRGRLFWGERPHSRLCSRPIPRICSRRISQPIPDGASFPVPFRPKKSCTPVTSLQRNGFPPSRPIPIPRKTNENLFPYRPSGSREDQFFLDWALGTSPITDYGEWRI